MFYKIRRVKHCFIFVLTVFIFYLIFKSAQITHRSEDFQFLEALKEITSIAHDIKLPLFLIDESLVKSIHERKHGSNYVDVFENDKIKFVTFGTNAFFLQNKGLVFKVFERAFEINVLPSLLSRQGRGNKLFKSESSHFLLLHQRTKVLFHFVVFYEYMEHYYYHDQIDSDSMDVSVSAQISYGLDHPGVYDRKTMRTKLLMTESLVLNVPFDIPQFLKAKNESLFLPCNITRAQEFRKKFGSKDSENEEFMSFKKRTKHLLISVTDALHFLDIPFWISSGTCLGWFRQCDLIPYGKDVDIGVWAKDHSPDMIEVIQDHGLQLGQSFGKVNDSYELSFLDGHVKLDVFFFYDTPHYAWNGGTQSRTRKKFKYIFKRFTLCWTLFLDVLVRVPCDTEQYVRDNYGEGWFQPVTEWDWKKSPSNVFENGLWPEDELSEVIQIF